MPEAQTQVAIITDDPGWHGRELKDALAKHNINGVYLSLSDCLIEIKQSSEDLVLPGFEQLPMGVFVRGVSGGTLEQVIFRLDVLHALHDSGITVYNTPRAIERTVDKPLTSLLLKRAGLPTPHTWVCESIEQANAVLLSEAKKGYRTVLKPLFGSQGIGVHLISPDTGLIHDEKFAGVYYLQRFIEQAERPYSDIRLFVIEGNVVAAMKRQSQHWLTNRAQGAECTLFEPDAELISLAETACQVLQINYAGVDVIQAKTGQYFLIEVNSIPAWYGLQQVVDFNIAARLIDSFIAHITESKQPKACLN